jgi:hypothetical protein
MKVKLLSEVHIAFIYSIEEYAYQEISMMEAARRLSPDHTALHPSRQNSSKLPPWENQIQLIFSVYEIILFFKYVSLGGGGGLFKIEG